MMKTRIRIPFVLLFCVFVCVKLSLAQQPNDQSTTTTTTTTAASSTAQSSDPTTSSTTTTTTTTAAPSSDSSSTTEPSKDGGDKKPDGDGKNDGGSGEKDSSDDRQPKVFIIHHHYGDPQDLQELAKRLQPVGSSGGPDDNNNNDQLPPEYSDPNYPYGLQQQQPSDNKDGKEQAEDLTVFDPLGKYTDLQKKRQFFQDLLVSQLNSFEEKIEPMVEQEENITEKNDMEEVLGAVKDLKRMIENHQIFNITEMMEDWKEGKLKPKEEPPIAAEQQQAPMPPMPKVHHHYHFKPPRSQQQDDPQQPKMQPSMMSHAPIIQTPPSRTELYLNPSLPMTRTYLLVPQSRLIQPEFVPHFHPHSVPSSFSTPQMNPFQRDSRSNNWMSGPGPYNPATSNGGFNSPMMMYQRRRMSSSMAPSMYQNGFSTGSNYLPPRGNSMWARSASGDDNFNESIIARDPTAAMASIPIPSTNDSSETSDESSPSSSSSSPSSSSSSSSESSELQDMLLSAASSSSSNEENFEYQK